MWNIIKKRQTNYRYTKGGNLIFVQVNPHPTFCHDYSYGNDSANNMQYFQLLYHLSQY